MRPERIERLSWFGSPQPPREHRNRIGRKRFMKRMVRRWMRRLWHRYGEDAPRKPYYCGTEY